MMAGLWRFGLRAVVPVFGVILLASLAYAQWAAWNDPETAFFFLAPRAWELLIGAAAAVWLRHAPPVPPRALANGLSALGLAAIVFAVFAYDRGTPFSSLYALVPTGGAVLIILFAVPGTLVQALLSSGPLVGLGLISYSLYLWHQPLFAFARLRLLLEPDKAVFLALIALSGVLAVASYVWVEGPVRRGRVLAARRGLFMACGGAMALVLGAGSVIFVQDGLPARLLPTAAQIAAQVENRAGKDCIFSEKTGLPQQPVAGCGTGGAPRVMLLGDSHSNAISDTLSAQLDREGLAHERISYAACVPLPGFPLLGQPKNHCARFVQDSLDHARASGVEVLVLTARYPLYLDGWRFDNGEGGVEMGKPMPAEIQGLSPSDIDDPARKARVLTGYEAAIRALAQEFRVVLVHPVPEAGWDVPTLATKSVWFSGGTAEVATRLSAYSTRAGAIVGLFDRLATEENAIFAARIQDVLCDAERGTCLNATADAVYYYDDDHLSLSGAERVAPVIMDAIHRAVADTSRGR